ncbi:hypothetical protein D9M71_641680 [compost metagenome]
MMATAITVATTAEVRNSLSIEKALSLSTDRPMYQLTDGRPLIGVKVTMRVLPSTTISLKSRLMRGVFCGYASPRDFMTRALSG